MAQSHGKGPLPLKVIARRQDISVKYLEQLMAILRSAGLVKSVRGAKGGYILAKTPKQIKISELFRVLEGASLITVECVQDKDYCRRAADCTVRQLWTQVQQAVDGVLDSITLQELVARTEQKDS